MSGSKNGYIYIMEYYTAGRKREPLPFTTAWMELESIILSEMSQVVKDKYHMISLIRGFILIAKSSIVQIIIYPTSSLSINIDVILSSLLL